VLSGLKLTLIMRQGTKAQEAERRLANNAGGAWPGWGSLLGYVVAGLGVAGDLRLLGISLPSDAVSWAD